MRPNFAQMLPEAIHSWKSALGADAVIEAGEAQHRYGADTSSLHRNIAAALVPKCGEAVRKLVEVAARYKIPVYPISTGRNWGYGSANPPLDDCVIVDLSSLRRIVALDAELGLVTVEPGVTQGDLSSFLKQHSLPFMVPVTGAGPACSLLGNALERGYGITPQSDHFMAVTAIEAVLPTGELYRSPLAEMGRPAGAPHVFKWGVGPYLDGLFSQGNVGIVTQMTIALARRPEKVKAIYFSLAHDRQLEDAVTAVRELLRVAGGNIGGINLMSDSRVLAMSTPYPHASLPAGGALPQELIASLCREHGIASWTGVGSIYGSREHVDATCRIAKKLLSPHAKHIVMIDSERVRTAMNLVSKMPCRLVSRLQIKLSKLAAGLDLMEGTPNELALPLAYWKSMEAPPSDSMHPARDRCGLLWYAPIVPMRPDCVRRYVEMVRRECRKHDVDAAITLTSLSERAFDSTLPILFSRDRPEQEANADACYRALFQAGRVQGILPYRVGVQFMPLVVDPQLTCWRLNQRLKQALDPAGILAPGRYSMHDFNPAAENGISTATSLETKT